MIWEGTMTNMIIMVIWYEIMMNMIIMIWRSLWYEDDDGKIGRYDVDDSGSMDTKELGRLLLTLIDNGIKVIDDWCLLANWWCLLIYDDWWWSMMIDGVTMISVSFLILLNTKEKEETEMLATDMAQNLLKWVFPEMDSSSNGKMIICCNAQYCKYVNMSSCQ